MSDGAPSLRSRIKSDLIALVSMGFMAGVFVMTAIVYLIRGDMLGWIYAVAAVMVAGGAVFVGRRVLSRIP